tara:strand:- start:267 stop:560 length:294 start_codon:yes stop_codon:yes gene_type:complete
MGDNRGLINKIIKMEDAIINAIREKAVKKMINPTILMNNKDLKTFMKQIEIQVRNFKVGKHPRYEGIPIIGGIHIKQGKFIIYDEINDDIEYIATNN